MAVFPDRIVLKNSTDSEAVIEAAIASGGSDPITQGEIVIGLTPSAAKFYTLDGSGNVISLGGTAAGITAVVEDLAPQLGGNLDVNGFYINSASGGDVTIAPDTTGSFVVRGNNTDGSITLNCTANTHGVTIQSPPHADAATYSLILPSGAGTAGQVLTSQGGAQLTWEDAGSGGFADPMTTDGDIIIRSGGTTTRLGIGSESQVLTVSSGLPVWADASGGGGGGSSATIIAPFAHAYIDVNNVASTTSHTGMSSAAHVYSSGVESYIDFTFDTPQPDTDYSVLHSGESGWNVLEVENKTTSGFRISFYDEATGNFLGSAAVGIGAPVITVYASDPTVTVGGGSGGGGGSTGSRLTEAQTAASGVATFTGLGHNGTLVSVTSSLDAWIVLYGSAADRTADAGRSYSTDPAAGSGVLAEFYVTAGSTVLATPGTSYFNNDTSVTEALYAAVRDQAGASVNSQVTIVAYGEQTITTVTGGTFGSG